MPRRPSQAARGRSSRGTGPLSCAGSGCPVLARLLHHDYPVTPGICARPAGIAPGCRRRVGLEHIRVAGRDRLVSSAAEFPTCRSSRVTTSARAGLGGARSKERGSARAAESGRCARSGGTASRESLVARGADRERVRVFANTIDVAAWEQRADGAARTTAGAAGAVSALADDDVVVLSVARLVTGKGSRHARPRRSPRRGDARLLVVVAGDGPDAPRRGARPRPRGAAASDRRSLRRRGRRDLRRRRRLCAPLDAGRPGVSSSTRPRPPGCRSCSQTGSAPRMTCCATVENGVARPGRRRRGDDRCARTARRRRSDSASRPDAVARARRASWGYEPSVESFVAAVREAAAR